jgi:hypothetical protein
MTVNNSANKTIAVGNGVQTVFNFSFIAVAANDISVILTDSSGNETTLAPAAYTLTLNAAAPGQLWSIGGNVTYPLVGSPIPIGSTLTIIRELSLTQLVSLNNQGNLFPSAVETALDLIEMQLQQVSELFQRALVAPVVDATAPLPLPPIAQRANQVLAFDSAGNPIAGSTPSSGIISTAMQPVVDAATLALGRTAFGLAAMATEGIGAGLQDDGSGNARVNSAVNPVATNQSVHAANHLALYVATGALVFTFDRANTLFSGFTVKVYALTAAITFAIDSHDNFFGQSSGASLIIPKGSVAIISTDAGASGVFYADVRGVSPVINVQTFTSNGTYTASPGLLYAVAEVQGDGGAGGGGANFANCTTGGGGGGGAYARAVLTPAQIGASQSVVVGTGGLAVSGGAGNNGNGSNLGALCGAAGGTGGAVGTSGGGGAPGLSGVTGTGSLLIPGGDGMKGFFAAINTVLGLGGQGGNGRLGSGGQAVAPGTTSAVAGNAGKNYGGGGGGGAVNNGGPVAGGNGAPGIVIVTEYLAFAA